MLYIVYIAAIAKADVASPEKQVLPEDAYARG